MNAPATNVQTITKKPQSIADLGAFLGTRMKQIKSVIASNLTPEKMARISLNELRNNDFLAEIAIQNPESFVNAVVQASHLGLEIGGVLGQAYLVPYKGEIKMMPGYRGLISLARRSGEITSINAEIVFANDEFDLVLGVDPKVTHKPKLDGERGEPRLAYMVAHFKDGGYHFEWMTISEVLSIKERSAAGQSAKASGKKTPWDTDRDEMIRKTVIRRGWKYLPMSIEMQTAQMIESANEQGKSVVIEGDSVLVQDGPEDGNGYQAEPETYPEDKFAAAFKKDSALIVSGRKTADDLIAMYGAKYPLTDGQIAAIRAVKKGEVSKKVTMGQQIERNLLDAKDIDVLSVAADLIGELADPAERTKLTELYSRRKEELSA